MSDQTALQRTLLNNDHDEDGKTANFNQYQLCINHFKKYNNNK